MGIKALSQFVSATLIIMLSIVAISLILTVLNPVIEKAKDSAIINEGFQNLELIDNTIREVASEGEDSRRTINLKITEGTYRIDSTNDFINFTYRMKEGLDISGQRDNVNIARSGNDITLFITYTNLDIEGLDHFTKGANSVLILHNGTNSITNYPKIYLGKSLPTTTTTSTSTSTSTTTTSTTTTPPACSGTVDCAILEFGSCSACGCTWLTPPGICTGDGDSCSSFDQTDCDNCGCTWG